MIQRQDRLPVAFWRGFIWAALFYAAVAYVLWSVFT